MKQLRILERKYIPKLRYNKWYKMIKFFTLLPLILPYALYVRGFQWIVDKIRIRRNGKPDIVLRNILEGWANYAIPNAVTEELAHKRASICAQCPLAQMDSTVHSIVVDNKTKQIRGMVCTGCSCPLSAKVRSSHDSCPKGKW